MKKNIVLLSLLLLIAISSFAQRGGRGGNAQKPKNPEERAARYTQMMTKRLKLNGEQSTQIGSINKETALQIASIRQEVQTKRKTGEAVDIKAYRERIKEANQVRDTKTIALLNNKQKTDYEALKAQMKQKAQERKNNKSKGGKGRKLNGTDQGGLEEMQEDELDTEEDDL
ncbi:hypothetical protein AD998_06525 [bacterium 336/3]|nr:hypothetical protein AD998_06525 [bacterium 336/3]